MKVEFKEKPLRIMPSDMVGAAPTRAKVRTEPKEWLRFQDEQRDNEQED